MAGLFQPLPVFFIVTALTALISELTVMQEMTEAFTSMSYGKVSLVIHLLLPPAVGLLAALGVFYAGGLKKTSLKSQGPVSESSPAVLDSDERARAIQRSLPLALVCLSPAGEITFLNPAAHAIFETVSATAGETLKTLLEQADLSHLIEQVKDGGTFTVENAFFSSDHLSIPLTLRITGMPVRKNDIVVEVLLALEDISAVKQLEEDLIRSEDRYRNIFNYAHCGIFFVDRNGNYIDANPAALDMLGYSLEELTQLNTREISSQSNPRIRKLLDTPGWVVEETRYMRKDGQIVDAELAASSYRSGKDIYFIGITKDITGHKRLERDVANLRASLSALLSAVPDALVLLSADGKVVDLNGAAADILDVDRADSVNLPATDLFGGNSSPGLDLAVDNSVEVTLPAGRTVAVRCRAVSPPGEGEQCRLIELMEKTPKT